MEKNVENLIQTYLLDNTHASIVTLIPKTGLAAENDAKTAEKLQKYKESLSKEEIEKIIVDTKELAAYQEEEESEEALETIPLLKRSDIKRESIKLYNDEHEVDGTTVLHHNVFTNGIDRNFARMPNILRQSSSFSGMRNTCSPQLMPPVCALISLNSSP